MRSASSAVVIGSVVSSHHSMAGVPSGGAISRANTTVIGGAAGVVAGRWVGRAIGTTVVRHSNVASRSDWAGFLGTVTFMVPRTGAASATSQRGCSRGSASCRFHAPRTDQCCWGFLGAINPS